MNGNNRNRLCAGLAFIIADICILCLANTNTKKDSDKTKAYQEPSSASSSICSKYVKEETEFEQHLVTPEETKETNTDVINTNNDQNTITDGYDAYYNKYIAYVNSAKFENKFYLFNVDLENKICTEANGLMTLDIYDLIQYNPIIVFDALTDEEKQLFPSNKNVKTIEETEEDLKKIRTPQEIIDDLNKKYFHKNDEEILSQLKEDASNNEKHPTSLVKIVLTENNDNFVPVLDLGNDVYYEINGDNYWKKDTDKIKYNSLSVFVDSYEAYSAFKKPFLSVNELYEVTNLISQDFKQKRSDNSRSLTK